jgi:hypothetical protein
MVNSIEIKLSGLISHVLEELFQGCTNTIKFGIFFKSREDTGVPRRLSLYNSGHYPGEEGVGMNGDDGDNEVGGVMKRELPCWCHRNSLIVLPPSHNPILMKVF